MAELPAGHTWHTTRARLELTAEYNAKFLISSADTPIHKDTVKQVKNSTSTN